jgi:hypothetical protein
VLHTTIEIDLVRLTDLLQDLFRFMPLLGWEDRVDLSSTDGQWALDLLQFLRLYKAGMSTVSYVDFPLLGSQMSDNVLRTEAVADSTDSFAAKFGSHFDQGGLDDRVDDRREVPGRSFEPTRKIECLEGSVQWDGIAMENVRHHDEVAVCCQLVGDELRVYEEMANDIGETGGK